MEYVLEEKKGPAHVEVVSAVYGTVIVCVCVDVCVGGWVELHKEQRCFKQESTEEDSGKSQTKAARE